uniref:Tektin n=1 Tax=Hydra vulgaris TaxID=6087 RepID=T2M8E8_HYDVU
MDNFIVPNSNYTIKEWNDSNQIKYNQAYQELQTSELIQDESKRFSNEIHISTIKTHLDVNKKIEQRIDEIQFWKSELDSQFLETENEIQNLLKYQKRTEAFLKMTEVPLEISKQCIKNREKRISIDLVYDDVEVQLLKEVEIIEIMRVKLTKTIAQVVEKIRLLRSSNYYIGKDIADKFSALKIDNYCYTINSDSLPLQDKTSKNISMPVTPEVWEYFSDKNLRKAQQEYALSLSLRSKVDEMLHNAFECLQNQSELVNLALSKRIDETELAKKKFQENLSKVLVEIDKMDDNINEIQCAVEENDAPLQVAQIRLDERACRPNIELCLDRVERKLREEVNEIKNNVIHLQSMMLESKMSLKCLLSQKLTLEESIAIKENTLFIDRDQNLLLRKQIVYEEK